MILILTAVPYHEQSRVIGAWPIDRRAEAVASLLSSYEHKATAYGERAEYYALTLFDGLNEGTSLHIYTDQCYTMRHYVGEVVRFEGEKVVVVPDPHAFEWA